MLGVAKACYSFILLGHGSLPGVLSFHTAECVQSVLLPYSFLLVIVPWACSIRAMVLPFHVSAVCSELLAAVYRVTVLYCRVGTHSVRAVQFRIALCAVGLI
jgi:hypothetical protein